MVKSCRVKKRTIRGKKRKGFNGSKQRQDDVVNSNVNNAVNAVNTQENDKNCLVNKTNNDDGEMVDPSIYEVNSSTISERKVEAIENSEPTFHERSISGNRIVDMELFAAVIHMLVGMSSLFINVILKTSHYLHMKVLYERISKWAHLSFYDKQFSRYLHLKFEKEVIFLGRFFPYEIPESGNKISNF